VLWPLGLPTGHLRSAGVRLTRCITLVAATILAPVAIVALAPGDDSEPAASRVPVPDLVELRPGAFGYRAAGEFTRAGKPVTAPAVTAAIKGTLAVTRHQITAADYQRCIEAGACPFVDVDAAVSDLPMVKVSWRDAHAYASWLSRETGERFRLPTDEEWAYAAAGRFHDDALPETLDVGDPGQRALAIYDRDAIRQEKFDPLPRPIGSFGANENGSSMWRAMSGNGPTRVTRAPRSIRAVKWPRRRPIAASASSRAVTDHTSQTSFAMRGRAAARPGRRRAI
jgi:formylglycine-generating enzyme required for sulfatase activity